MAWRHCGVSEQADLGLLGASDGCDRLFQPELASAQTAGLDLQPGGLGQFLHQSDKQSDREANHAQAEQARKEPSSGDTADQVEGDSPKKPPTSPPIAPLGMLGSDNVASPTPAPSISPISIQPASRARIR